MKKAETNTPEIDYVMKEYLYDTMDKAYKVNYIILDLTPIEDLTPIRLAFFTLPIAFIVLRAGETTYVTGNANGQGSDPKLRPSLLGIRWPKHTIP